MLRAAWVLISRTEQAHRIHYQHIGVLQDIEAADRTERSVLLAECRVGDIAPLEEVEDVMQVLLVQLMWYENQFDPFVHHASVLHIASQQRFIFGPGAAGYDHLLASVRELCHGSQLLAIRPFAVRPYSRHSVKACVTGYRYVRHTVFG